MNFTPFETSRLRLRPQEAKDAATFRHSGTTTEYKNLTFQKTL